MGHRWCGNRRGGPCVPACVCMRVRARGHTHWRVRPSTRPGGGQNVVPGLPPGSRVRCEED